MGQSSKEVRNINDSGEERDLTSFYFVKNTIDYSCHCLAIYVKMGFSVDLVTT